MGHWVTLLGTGQTETRWAGRAGDTSQGLKAALPGQARDTIGGQRQARSAWDGQRQG